MGRGTDRGGSHVPGLRLYHDHRMAMAFAPAALKHPGLVIVDKEVVSKSFPPLLGSTGRMFLGRNRIFGLLRSFSFEKIVSLFHCIPRLKCLR